MESISVTMLSSANSLPTIAPAQPTLAVNQSLEDISNLGPANRISTLGLITRKEWIIPPRPKPGRKPATDTPPTKRKAQNRAAQRAFRERRAARVGELEEQLEGLKEEQQQLEAELRSKVEQLEADVGRFRVEIDSWKLRCDIQDSIITYEKGAKEAALAELACLRKNFQATKKSSISSTKNLLPLPSQQRLGPFGYRSYIEPDSTDCVVNNTKNEDIRSEGAFDGSGIGCGNCTLLTSCACIEDTLKESLEVSLTSESERAHSPATNVFSDIRSRQLEPYTPLEIDFTTQFATKSIDQTKSIEQTSLIESCGFCDDGTFCLCAAAVDAAVSDKEQRETRENCLELSFNEAAPPTPALSVINRKAELHRTTQTQYSELNENGPGTCQQCQADPRSGKFCRSLSKLQSSESKFPGGCCGKSNNGSCCKSKPTIPIETPRLSCADAYRTLSSHKNYDQADTELGTWLGRLHAAPPAHPNRGPMEVEAASVMEVMKHFDRRFKKP